MTNKDQPSTFSSSMRQLPSPPVLFSTYPADPTYQPLVPLLLLQTLLPHHNRIMLCFDVLPTHLPGHSFPNPLLLFSLAHVSSGLASCFLPFFSVLCLLQRTSKFYLKPEQFVLCPLLPMGYYYHLLFFFFFLLPLKHLLLLFLVLL